MRFLVNDEIILGWSPKCACGTIKDWFIRAFGIEYEGNPHAIIRGTTFPKIVKGRDYKDRVKAIAIRNPYSRLVSGYTGRCVFRDKPVKNVSFRELVEILEKEIFDNHFAPQTSEEFVPLSWDLVLEQRRLNTDIGELNQIVGREIEPKTFGKSPERQPYSNEDVASMRPEEIRKHNPFWRLYYNKYLKKRVRDIYRQDFEYFESIGIHYDIK